MPSLSASPASIDCCVETLAFFDSGGIMVPSTILGLIPAKGQLLPILLREGIRLGLPFAQQIAQDPAGTVSRVGEALVWNGTKGQQVLAGLASLSEGQSRI